MANQEALNGVIGMDVNAHGGRGVGPAGRRAGAGRTHQSPGQLFDDPQLNARGALWEVWVDGTRMVLPRVGPCLQTVAPRRDHPGGALGADTRAVLMELAGMSETEVDRLIEAPADPS